MLLVLAFAAAAYASGDGAIPKEKWMDLLWRTTNFAGLVIILVFFLKKPFVDGLSSRREGIKDQLDALESRKAEAEQLYKEAEAKLAKLDEEVNAIISEAVKQGEAEKEKIITDAERAAGDIKRQAEMAVAHEVAEAKARLKGQTRTRILRYMAPEAARMPPVFWWDRWPPAARLASTTVMTVLE